jgi:hypothetical protein
MRTDRKFSGGSTVEFIGENAEPPTGDDDPAFAIPVRGRALMAAGLLALAVVFAAVGHDHSAPTAAPRPHVPARTRPTSRPAIPAPIAHATTRLANSPSAAITKAFATDLPGSVVLYERTSLTNRGRELGSRTIRAITGNVVLDVVVARSSTSLPSHATRILQSGYAVTIRSKGYYPPTREQLRHLATDRRLTAVV